jgi:hypothetical protein
MKCAERSIEARDEAAALRLYEALLGDGSLPLPSRKAAVMGRIRASGSAGQRVLIAYLEGPKSRCTTRR